MTSRTVLRRQKNELRAQVRAVRDAIPPLERVRSSDEIERRLFSLPEIREAGTVMCFASFGAEVSTEDIIGRLIGEGCRVALPRVVGGEIEAAPYRPGDPVVVAPFGAAEPQGDAALPPEEVDVVITPGLAFDRDGYRVGYGGGFYDRFFRRTRGDALRVGICFAVQLVDAVPHGPADERVDLLVTERELVGLPTRNGRRARP
ncbi:MAG: 5-formyltetrahydrofolate cyclo-ligase [Actinomycetota bacterium]